MSTTTSSTPFIETQATLPIHSTGVIFTLTSFSSMSVGTCAIHNRQPVIYLGQIRPSRMQLMISMLQLLNWVFNLLTGKVFSSR